MSNLLGCCGSVLTVLAIVVQARSCVERLQARKSATFILTDRTFTCPGEVVGVKACGGPPSSSGTHFYLSLYASSNDSVLFPEVVRTQWGIAGGSEWKPVTRNERSANTPADSRGSKVCYSPGDFLGVTVYHQHGNDTRCSLPVHVAVSEVPCDENSPLGLIVRITEDCYDSLALRNDSHKSTVTITVTPTESSSYSGLTAGIVILLVGIVVETVFCSAVWLACWRRISKGDTTSARELMSAINLARHRVHNPGSGAEPADHEIPVAPSTQFSVLLQGDEENESQDLQQEQYEGPETAGPAHDQPTISASATQVVEDKEGSNDYWSPGESVEDVYSQMTLRRFVVIPGQAISLGQLLGEGEYGVVYKGAWSSPSGVYLSAVKVLKDSADKDDRVKLLQEGAIMGQFCHPNVVRLHGVVKEPDPVMLVMEYLPGGDLRNHLLKARELMDTRMATGILYQQLLAFCTQIASGMAYLSAKGFVHRDLAARNVLLDTEHRCKIADFGMSRNVDEDSYYKTKGGMIPIKWTAPEAILYRRYTTKSDVWSYGMVMYEIWSLGHKPFEDFSVDEIIKCLSASYCQPPPPGCPKDIYALMVHCWNPSHTQRPSFMFLMHELKRSPDTLLRVEAGHAHLLGAPLEASKDLYLDLQQTYTG